MTLARRAVVVSALVAAALTACASGQPMRWSGESKNSDEQLTSAQRTAFRQKLRQLHEWMPEVAPAARSLALLVEDGEPGETPQRSEAARLLVAKLEPMLKRDAALRSLSFLSGNFFELVTVEKTAEARIDFHDVEPGLRGQIGFFPEDPNTRIEDFDGYPNPQYTVATRGRTGLRIRVPLTADGFYLGDLVAEYELQ